MSPRLSLLQLLMSLIVLSACLCSLAEASSCYGVCGKNAKCNYKVKYLLQFVRQTFLMFFVGLLNVITSLHRGTSACA